MKIDCSKTSNKSDLLAMLGATVIIFVLAITFLLAAYFDGFLSGISIATLTWKWHDWIYKPIDQALDKLWPKD